MKLEDLIKQVSELQPTMALLPKLLRLLRSTESSMEDLVEIIRLDPPLMAQILKVSNSALFGGGTQLYDVGEAIGRIGFARTYQLVGMLAGQKMLAPDLKAYKIESGELWENSVVTAKVCENLAKTCNADFNLAYTCGLLHSIGKFVLNRYSNENYSEIYNLIQNKKETFLEAEKDVFGTDHAEVGGALLDKWGFNDDVIIPIRYQYNIKEVPDHKQQTAILHLANWAVAGAGGNYGQFALAFEVDSSALGIAGLTEDQVLEALPEAASIVLETKETLSGITEGLR